MAKGFGGKKYKIPRRHRIRPYDISPLSFGRRLLGLLLKRDILIREALECVRFYFTAYGVGRLFAIASRAGCTYVLRIIDSAWDIAQGGTGEYYYETQKETWQPSYLETPCDLRTPLKKARSCDPDSRMPIIFSTRSPYHHIENRRKRNMKVVLLVRHLFDLFESELLDMKVSDQEDFLRSGLIDFTIGFYNSWGKFLEDHHNALLVKYEELLENPCEVIKRMLRFWELDLPESCIRRAVAMCSKEEMIRRIPPEKLATNPRVSAVSHGGILSRDTAEFIKNKIKKHLRYSLGYDYSNYNYVTRQSLVKKRKEQG